MSEPVWKKPRLITALPPQYNVRPYPLDEGILMPYEGNFREFELNPERHATCQESLKFGCSFKLIYNCPSSLFRLYELSGMYGGPDYHEHRGRQIRAMTHYNQAAWSFAVHLTAALNGCVGNDIPTGYRADMATAVIALRMDENDLFKLQRIEETMLRNGIPFISPLDAGIKLEPLSRLRLALERVPDEKLDEMDSFARLLRVHAVRFPGVEPANSRHSFLGFLRCMERRLLEIRRNNGA